MRGGRVKMDEYLKEAAKFDRWVARFLCAIVVLWAIKVSLMFMRHCTNTMSDCHVT